MTRASGTTAPLESVTMPESVPVSTWAIAAEMERMARMTKRWGRMANGASLYRPVSSREGVPILKTLLTSEQSALPGEGQNQTREDSQHEGPRCGQDKRGPQTRAERLQVERRLARLLHVHH